MPCMYSPINNARRIGLSIRVVVDTTDVLRRHTHTHTRTHMLSPRNHALDRTIGTLNLPRPCIQPLRVRPMLLKATMMISTIYLSN